MAVGWCACACAGWHDEAQAHQPSHSQSHLEIYEDTVCVGNIQAIASTSVQSNTGGSRQPFGGAGRSSMGGGGGRGPSGMTAGSGGLQLYEDTEFIAGQ